MSGHAKDASADLEAQNAENHKRTLPHDAQPDAENPSDAQPDAQPDAENPFESKRKMPRISPKSVHFRSEIDEEPDAQPDAENPDSDDLDSRSDVSTYIRLQKTVITEEEWMNSIKYNRPRFSSDVSIFKVRMFLKDTKREAYVPKQVSLGPYHQGRKELPQMNNHKGRAVRRMMIRRNKNMGGETKDDFPSKAKEEILKLRDAILDIYQEPIPCDEDTLARMLCWDGCFILEVLRTLGRDSNDRNDPNEKNDPIFGENKASRDRNENDGNEKNDPIFGENKASRDRNENDGNEKNDPIFGENKASRDRNENDGNEKNDPIFGENKAAASNLLKDILMLENQIPHIVLLKLLGLEDPNDKHVEKTLLEVLVEGTCGLFKFSKDKSALKQYDFQGFHHLLHFLHKVIVHGPSNRVNPEDQAENCIDHCLIMLQGNKASNDIESIPRAVELKHAGIKFQQFKGGIKEIIFDSPTIYLPSVSVTYGTEVLFRNLIAFEICRPSEGNYVTSYVHLMDDLIDSEEDVALLRSEGILTTLLGSDKEVADLFNGLCNETVRTKNSFDEVRKGVNAHYKNKIRIQFAELVREHFSSPWKALALAAASFLLILTLIQTIFTFLSYFPNRRSSQFLAIFQIDDLHSS